jgi:hypothetical protein
VSTVITAFMLHMPLTTSVLQLFTCRTLDDSGRTFLVADLSVECTSTSNLLWMLGIGVPTFILYTLGIPAAVWWILRANGGAASARDPDVIRRYGFLFVGYRPKWYFWEAVIMLRKAAFAITTVILASSGLRMQIYTTLMWTLAALMAHMHAKPHRSWQVNALDEASLLVTIVTMICGLILGEPESGPIVGGMATVLVIFSNLGTLVVIATAFVHAKRREIAGVLQFVAKANPGAAGRGSPTVSQAGPQASQARGQIATQASSEPEVRRVRSGDHSDNHRWLEQPAHDQPAISSRECDLPPFGTASSSATGTSLSGVVTARQWSGRLARATPTGTGGKGHSETSRWQPGTAASMGGSDAVGPT